MARLDTLIREVPWLSSTFCRRLLRWTGHDRWPPWCTVRPWKDFTSPQRPGRSWIVSPPVGSRSRSWFGARAPATALSEAPGPHRDPYLDPHTKILTKLIGAYTTTELATGEADLVTAHIRQMFRHPPSPVPGHLSLGGAAALPWSCAKRFRERSRSYRCR